MTAKFKAGRRCYIVHIYHGYVLYCHTYQLTEKVEVDGGAGRQQERRDTHLGLNKTT